MIWKGKKVEVGLSLALSSQTGFQDFQVLCRFPGTFW